MPGVILRVSPEGVRHWDVLNTVVACCNSSTGVPEHARAVTGWRLSPPLDSNHSGKVILFKMVFQAPAASVNKAG